ncbi:MAG: hypothetical protein M3495_13015 [Pseudomonadota bacterium]|nr:hypothetical protein [Pseudomonadota bacterium]
MGRVCREVQEWVEEQIERPIEEWENRQEQRCRKEECNWWILCLNKLFCWLVWVAVKVVRWVVVTVGKWVARIVCEVVNFVLDVVGFIVELILSIPIIGGIIRTILNWVTEIIWRLVGIFDFLGSLAGIRLRKKMYFGVIVPPIAPIASDADIQRQVDAVVDFYGRTCNINMIFTGICHTDISPPDGGLTVGCDEGGFFSDWWLTGSYFEFASATCKFTDSFRRVIGLGAEIIVFVVQNVTPANTNGCSFASTHNWVIIEALPTDQAFVAAHEIGHACWLPHDGDRANLMNPITPAANPTLTNVQIALVRWSKHCVYI